MKVRSCHQEAYDPRVYNRKDAKQFNDRRTDAHSSQCSKPMLKTSSNDTLLTYIRSPPGRASDCRFVHFSHSPPSSSAQKDTINHGQDSTVLGKSKPKRRNQDTERDTNSSSTASRHSRRGSRRPSTRGRGTAALDRNEGSAAATTRRRTIGRGGLGNGTTKDTTSRRHVARRRLGCRRELVKVVGALGVDGADHASLAVLALGAVEPQRGGRVDCYAEHVVL